MCIMIGKEFGKEVTRSRKYVEETIEEVRQSYVKVVFFYKSCKNRIIKNKKK